MNRSNCRALEWGSLKLAPIIAAVFSAAFWSTSVNPVSRHQKATQAEGKGEGEREREREKEEEREGGKEGESDGGREGEMEREREWERRGEERRERGLITMLARALYTEK